jgi:integrase
MRTAGTVPHGARVRALLVIMSRAGLWINEALTLAETDLEPRGGAILVRHGKGGKRREVGTTGPGSTSNPARHPPRTARGLVPVRCRRRDTRPRLVAERRREGVPLPIIQLQLGHAHLGVTSTYLQGIDTGE